MTIPPTVIYILQGFLLLAGTYMLWTGWRIRRHDRFDLIKGSFGKALDAPHLIAGEYGIYSTVFGMALLGVVVAWSGMPLTFASATILTTFVALIGTGWRGMLIRLHDHRLKLRP